MPRPIVARIHAAAMRHNLNVARQCAPRSRVWAVVKANAYGHGLARAMQAFDPADGLALVEVDAALRLRDMGWKKPVLLLEGFFDESDLPELAARDIQFAIHCREQIDMLEQARLGGQIDVHLKMNSGMNRLGFKPEHYREAYQRLQAIPAVRSVTLMMHFANADDPANAAMPMAEQIRRFEAATEGLEGNRSLANSAAVLTHPDHADQPDIAADWVRPGIMLYGGTPGGRTAEEFGLQPAMTLESEVIGVQRLRAGDAVGYGSRFVADKDMIIGVVAGGYADGYPRHAPAGTPVMVDGRRTCIVGRVSMDMVTVDLTEVAGAGFGSKVELWGRHVPIDEVAGAAGTIGYELMCALAPGVAVIED